MPGDRARAVAPGLATLFRAGSLVGVADGALLERFAARDGEGSEAAFAALVERHGPMVWRACRAALRDGHDADDAFQAAFLVLARKAGSLRVRDSIAPWLHRVAVRAAGEARRTARRRREAEHQAARIGEGSSESPMPDDLVDILHREIDRLPERHRAVVVLCDLEGRPIEEAAQHLGCPVGTVKSRLARARDRLRAALLRRGVGPEGLSPGASGTVDRPPRRLDADAIRGAFGFAVRPVLASEVVSKSAVILAEGVLRVVIRTRVQGALLAAVAAVGMLMPAWVVLARQAADDPPVNRARGEVLRAAPDLAGNWIVRGYPSGQSFALIRIEGPRERPGAVLLSVTSPELFRLARSKVENLRVSGETVRLTMDLKADRPIDGRRMEVVAYLPGGGARPETLWGAMEFAGQGQYPARIERTDRKEIDRQEGQAAAPWGADLDRYYEEKDRARKDEILGAMLEKYGETPVAQYAAMCRALERADAGAPRAEVRLWMDRAVRSASRYGREMEVGTINWLIRPLVGNHKLEADVLEYARKAVAMLRPADSANLQEGALKNLASALRKAVKIDEAKARAEVQALEDRIAALPPGARSGRARRVGPATRNAAIPWARNFADGRERARAEGKLLLVEFVTEHCGWCDRLDADVFTDPAVAAAMRPFVPVKVDADDGEGRPLAERYEDHVSAYPTTLFLDPAIEDPKDGRIVGKISGYMPAGSFAEQLITIAGLPRDIDGFGEKVHPEDGDAMRRLATAMAMQGRVKEAAALIERAWGPGSDPNFDRWASVYNTIGDEVMLDMKPGAESRGGAGGQGFAGRAMMLLRLGQAAGWFQKAMRIAKRPIDVYNAHLGAGFAAMLIGRGNEAARELSAAARVEGISDGDRAFAREVYGHLSQPGGVELDAATIPEAAAARKLLDAARTRAAGGRAD